jgi:hypothetical protein
MFCFAAPILYLTQTPLDQYNARDVLRKQQTSACACQSGKEHWSVGRGPQKEEKKKKRQAWQKRDVIAAFFTF